MLPLARAQAATPVVPNAADNPGEFQIAPYNAPALPPFKTLENGLLFSGHLDLEVVGVAAGGLRRQVTSDAVLQLGGQLDTSQAGLWRGGLFEFSLMGLRTDGNLPAQTGALQTTSNNWASNFLRLYQFTYRQDVGPAFYRVGIMDVNYYFSSVGVAAQLQNASFGFVPTLTSNANIATFLNPGLGLMGGVTLGDGYALQAGVWQANPPEFSGVLHAGALALAEASKSIGALADGQPWQVFKLGVWHMRQNDPLLGPSTGGVYGISETRWDVANGPRYGAFVQLAACNGRVNALPYYLGLGLRVQRPLAGRDDDSFSIGLARANLRGQPHPETVLEATYAYKLAAGVYLQPDAQRIWHPSGVNPAATVLGARLHLEF